MKTAFIENTILYDGSQLASHFAYRQLGLLGDSCVAFLGPCDVKVAALVDLEDVRQNAPIFSPRMVHFILESFSLDLKGGVFLQRLMMAALKDALEEFGATGFRREGDDLYQGYKKLSVSIATRSAVSTLIHVGINVQTEHTPVPTVGLSELSIPEVDFAKKGLEGFKKEYEDSLLAACKVRGV